MAADSNPRAATEIDRLIGVQIRVRRSAAGFSQEALAEAIGVTFQQIQKYEKGVNRVSAATLYRIARALNVHPAILMPGDEDDLMASPPEFETIAALAHPISRLNSSGRDVLVALAQALASHPGTRA